MQVVAAYIVNDKDEILICQRPFKKGKSNGWEFPGGRVKKGEDFKTALKREIKEELDIEIKIKEMILKFNFKGICFILFLSYIKAGIPRPLYHSEIRWVKKQELRKYQFLELDRKVIKRLFDKNCDEI